MSIRHFYAKRISNLVNGFAKYEYTADSISMADFGTMIIDVNNKRSKIEKPMTDETIENQEVCILALTSKILKEYEKNQELPRETHYVS
ncbi:hypothetical protein [Chroococcidiopsis thermalis]|uniref:Uncharacterized protein n=1 Tax=Chroococcidiopsis thermalis (strain PCC 7203) TaxID=251229 RepID=K9TWW4_CHRTP|nr:hypothetical protein [Chroococcidiopsis thermalis]AFY86873.1 hypothetical protein Chro_1347 [Chroococcidiopsis thermalis PCC 7203]